MSAEQKNWTPLISLNSKNLSNTTGKSKIPKSKSLPRSSGEKECQLGHMLQMGLVKKKTFRPVCGNTGEKGAVYPEIAGREGRGAGPLPVGGTPLWGKDLLPGAVDKSASEIWRKQREKRRGHITGDPSWPPVIHRFEKGQNEGILAASKLDCTDL